MPDILERPFRFTTPVIHNGLLLGNLDIKGVGATYEDDVDLLWTSYALDHVKWPDDNIKSLMFWAGSHDLDHIIKEHLRWLFSDLSLKTA